MKKTTFLILIILSSLAILNGCGSDNIGPYGSSAIVDESNSVEIKDVLFTVDLINSNNNFLVTQQLLSAEIYINNEKWGEFDSDIIDVTLYNTEIENNLLVANDPIEYLFITSNQLTLDSLLTAGDYSNALNSFYQLQPGGYIAELRLVSFINEEDTITVKTRKLLDFQIAENSESVFIGNFVIDLNL